MKKSMATEVSTWQMGKSFHVIDGSPSMLICPSIYRRCLHCTCMHHAQSFRVAQGVNHGLVLSITFCESDVWVLTLAITVRL